MTERDRLLSAHMKAWYEGDLEEAQWLLDRARELERPTTGDDTMSTITERERLQAAYDEAMTYGDFYEAQELVDRLKALDQEPDLDPALDAYARAHLREVEERERAGWAVCPVPPSPWKRRLSLWRLRRLTEAMREAVEQGRLEL